MIAADLSLPGLEVTRCKGGQHFFMSLPYKERTFFFELVMEPHGKGSTPVLAGIGTYGGQLGTFYAFAFSESPKGLEERLGEIEFLLADFLLTAKNDRYLRDWHRALVSYAQKLVADEVVRGAVPVLQLEPGVTMRQLSKVGRSGALRLAQQWGDLTVTMERGVGSGSTVRIGFGNYTTIHVREGDREENVARLIQDTLNGLVDLDVLALEILTLEMLAVLQSFYKTWIEQEGK